MALVFPYGLRSPKRLRASPTLPVQPGWRWTWFPRVQLTEGIVLSAIASVASTATGDIEVSTLLNPSLSGDGVSIANSSGDIEISVLTGGDALVIAAATASLTLEVGGIEVSDLTGDAKVVSTAAGALGSATPLQGGAISDAESMGNADANTPLAGSGQDTVSASGAMQPQTGLSGAAQDTVSVSGDISESTPLTGSAPATASASGSVQSQMGMAGAATGQVTASGAPTVGIRLDAVAQASGSASGSLADVMALSGAGTITPDASGGLSTVDPERNILTYAVNLNTGAVTQFKNCSFDRLVRAHGVLYGLKDGNVYRFGGDQDPNSTPINASVRFAPQGFETGMKKRLIDTYLFSRIPGALRVLPIYDETEQLAYSSLGYERDGLINHKVKVGKGNAFHTLGLVVENTDGGTFDVGALRLNVQTLSRRI